MVDRQIEDDLDAFFMGFGHQGIKILEVAELRIDVEIIVCRLTDGLRAKAIVRT